MNTPENSSDKVHPLIAAKHNLDRRLVSHPRFREVMDRIKATLKFQTDTKLLYIIGPTGVGKSRLYFHIQNYIMDLIGKSLGEDRERIPYVAFEVPSVQIGNFSWRSFYQAYMEQLRLPLKVDQKSLKEIPWIPESYGPDYVLMNTLQHRRPMVTLLDEANHLAVVASGKLLRHQMEKIKSLANRSNVLHICFGTYELANMVDLSGQLARRSQVIHFGRYRAEDEIDMRAFEEMVCFFNKSIPVAHHMDLSTRASYLHERTIGCAGILKTWLMEALSRAYAAGRTAITMADLENTAYPLNKLRTMLTDAVEGEGQFLEHKHDYTLYLRDLGHRPDNEEPPSPSPTSPNPHKPSPAGERAPGRDPVGGAFQKQQVALAG